jgi:zinc protease
MKKFLYTIMILLAVANTIHAQVDRSKTPQPAPAPKIQIGDFTKFELPNGLKVYVVENHQLTRVSFSIALVFEPTLEGENAGISSIAASLIGTGTRTRTKDQINEEIDFIGASLSPSASGIYASSLKKHTNQLLEVLSDVTINSEFKAEELEKKRTQFLSNIAANKDDPHAIASNVSGALFYGKNHPYGEFETEASIKKVSLDMCTKYYQTYFRPNIAYLSVVGDITPSEAKKLVEKYFGAWQKGEVPSQQYAKPQPPETTRVALVDRPQSVQSVIKVGYPVDLGMGSPDLIKARVTNTVLGGGTFRLFDNLREKHGYTYGAYSSLNINPLVSSFEASTSARNAVTDSAITQIIFEMKRLRDEPVPASELSMVKNYMTGNFALSLENPQTIAAFAVNTERYKLPKDFYANYLKNIEAVTAADVQEMARKYILPEHSTIFVVGKASQIAEKLKVFSPQAKVDFYDLDAKLLEPAAKALPEGVNVKSVFQNYLKAVGGEQNIAKVTDITTKGSFSVQGMNLNLNIYQKIPGKYLVEIQMAGQTVQKIVLNGESCHSSGLQGSMDLTGAELEQMKLQAMPFPELEYDKMGYKTELKGLSKVNGKDAYQVDITSPGNSLSSDFFSVETGLKVRSVAQVAGVTQTAEFDDYTEVNGIKLPKTMKRTFGPQPVEIAIDQITVNTKLADDIFN